jgi:Domain of unknown function (DUF4258)
MKRTVPFIFLLLVAVVILFIRRCETRQQEVAGPKVNNNGKDPAGNISRDKDFDRRISYIGYSNHARCRMDCRHITQAEVQDIMQHGSINYSKSDLQNARCPRYALEGTTGDNQRVRIIFAQCTESTTVVTVIDLDTEWQCDCPGDNGSSSSPPKNQN